MRYRIETTERFDREFRKLDRYTQRMVKAWIDRNTQRMVKAWIDRNISETENPRQHGKGLTSNRRGQWRYRIGDYRLLCEIQDDRLVILALTIGHRREVYRR